MSTDTFEPLVSAQAVAEMLGVSPDTVRRYVRTEGLPYVRLKGKRVRFLRSAVAAWVAGRQAVQRPAEAPTPPPAPAPTPRAGRRAAGSADARAEVREMIRKARERG